MFLRDWDERGRVYDVEAREGEAQSVDGEVEGVADGSSENLHRYREDRGFGIGTCRRSM